MNNLTPSPWLYTFLRNYEKFRPTAYKPTPKDVWTCGFGHTRGVDENTTCTMEQAEAWLAQDAAEDVHDVNGKVTVALTQEQFDALCSLAFNIGETNFNGSTLLRKLNASDYEGAAAQFPRWDKQADEVLNGLLARRDAEMAHFLGTD